MDTAHVPTAKATRLRAVAAISSNALHNMENVDDKISYEDDGLEYRGSTV